MSKSIFFLFGMFFFYACSSEKQLELLPASLTGIHFANSIEETDSLNILTNEYIYNGGGVAVGDFNNDGLEDLYFTGNVVNNKMYLNQGELQFKDITLKANVACENTWSMGVSTIDINQDGWLDLYIAVTGKGAPSQRRNKLLINQGIGQDRIPYFEESAKSYGLDHDGFSINSYFFDYDNDGDLDLYVINNQFTNRGDVLSKRKQGKYKIEANINRLFRNEGNRNFTDVTSITGILNDGFSLAAVIVDVNHDGWEDIFVSNDFVTSSALYVNQKDGTFKEEIANYFKHQSFSSMGVDVADFDNNMEEDLISLDMLPRTPWRTKQMFSKANFLFYDLLDHYNEEPQYMRNCLYTSENKSYREISQLAGVHNTDWSWSPLFVDFDNDGTKDLSITNGFPRDLTDLDFINYRDSYASILATQKDYLDKIPRVKIANFLFKNNGQYQFSNVTEDWGLNHPSYSNGQAIADLDNDGDLELIVNNINAKAFLYQNHSNSLNRNNHISFSLKGPTGNKEALHANVTIFYDNKKQHLRLNPYRGYLSSISRKLHFGLGTGKRVDSLIIDWNNGHRTVKFNLDANKQYNFSFDHHQHKEKERLITVPPLLRQLNDSLSIHYTHKENKSYDFFQHELLLRVFTNEGPALAVGDINGDKIEDLVIGGGNSQPITFFFATNSGNFKGETLNQVMPEKEVTAIALFDVENDGDLDIYLGYGHNGSKSLVSLQDEIWLNDGTGKFSFNSTLLPKNRAVTSKVIPFDFDQDGDIDLFVGARILLDQYPKVPQSYYYENQGGVLKDLSHQKLPNKGFIGRIADAELFHENNESSIVFTGDWQGIDQLVYHQNEFVLRKNITGDDQNGLWNSLDLFDVDKDGDLDIVAGNYGLNTSYHASKEYPFLQLYGDLSGQGNSVAVLFNQYKGKYYPTHLRSNFLNQLQHKKKQFPNFETFSKATIEEVFTPKEKEKLKTLEVHTFTHSIFENKQGEFLKHTLPIEVQFSPLFASHFFSSRGKDYLLFVGNDNMHEVFTGPKNATQGELFTVDSEFNFKRIPLKYSGLNVSGSAKNILPLTTKDDTLLFISQNNDTLLVYGY